MKLTPEELYNGMEKVRDLLSNLTHNILFRPTHVEMYGQKQIDEIKAIISAVELHINPQSNKEQQPQLQQHDVSGRSEQFCSCSFVMIMRGEDDKPYCGSCKLLVDE